MSEYERTPSFYKTNDTFKKYLGKTSYYLNLQNAVLDIINYTDIKKVTELGSGLGHTTNRISKNNSEINITAVDFSEENIQKCKESNNNKNIRFINRDMVNYVCSKNIDTEFILMLYSFHHIEDPKSNKVNFINNVYNSMNENDYLCIGEAFLPENDSIEKLWKRRSEEGYASTFWESLSGIDSDSIEEAKKIGNFSRDHERIAGENVKNRDDEYLVKLSWLENTLKEIGFKIKLSEPVNAFNDYVILVEK